MKVRIKEEGNRPATDLTIRKTYDFIPDVNYQEYGKIIDDVGYELFIHAEGSCIHLNGGSWEIITDSVEETEERGDSMSSKIDIEINGVNLEVQIDGEAPEPSNGIAGGFDIIAVRRKGLDLWPTMKLVFDFCDFEQMIVDAIDKEAEKRREV